MIFLQSLLLVSVLTLIRSSLSTITPQPPPGYVPVDNRLLPSGESGPSTNATGNRTSARHNSTSNRGAGDSCGPRSTQTDFESTINTCGAINTTFTHAPSIYGVQCLNANPSWNQAVNLTSCFSNLVDICQTITQGLAPGSQWSWSSGGPNCTMGIWINELPAAQPSRTWETCKADVYGLMQSTCFVNQGGPFNVAAVNLQTLPDMGTNGSQVDSGYPSYIIVPETYNINPGYGAYAAAGSQGGEQAPTSGDGQVSGEEAGDDGGDDGGYNYATGNYDNPYSS